MRIAIVSPYAGSIVSFRGSLIEALVKRGIEVYVLAPDLCLLGENSRKGSAPISYLVVTMAM